MAELRELLEQTGFAAPQTLLHSGNVVFRGEAVAPQRLEALLETETEKHFGHRPSYFVRSAREWSEMVARNPFARGARIDPARLFAIVLKDAVRANALSALQASITGPERVESGKRVLYATYPAGMGESRLTNAVIERALATRATARNWNTVLKLAALAAEFGASAAR